MRAAVLLLALAACADDPVPVPHAAPPAEPCGDAAAPTFACCRDADSAAPDCRDNAYTCLDGWHTCALEGM